jgi:hypothetical protein
MVGLKFPMWCWDGGRAYSMLAVNKRKPRVGQFFFRASQQLETKNAS